jgi:hypothetical protein
MITRQFALTLFEVAALTALIGNPVSAQDTPPSPGVFVYAGGGAGLRVPIEARTVTGASYSAEVVTESVQTLADGNRIVQRSSARVYRDGQGRVRREENRPSGSPVVSITDPVAGTSFSLDPDSRVAWQAPHVAGIANGKVTAAFHSANELIARLPAGAAQKIVELRDLHAQQWRARRSQPSRQRRCPSSASTKR